MTYELMYHPDDSRRYNPMAPWHTKPHKHEFDGKIQRIHIYSDEHRPLSERGKARSGGCSGGGLGGNPAI